MCPNGKGHHLGGCHDHGIERRGDKSARAPSAPRTGDVRGDGADGGGANAHDEVLGSEAERREAHEQPADSCERARGLSIERHLIHAISGIDKRTAHVKDKVLGQVGIGNHEGATGTPHGAGEHFGELGKRTAAKAQIGAAGAKVEKLATNRHIRPRSKSSSATV